MRTRKKPTAMKLTQGIITREEAVALCPEYVRFAEGDFEALGPALTNFDQAAVGKEAITVHDPEGTALAKLFSKAEDPKSVLKNLPRLVFLRVKVSSVDHDDFRAVDGPVVRVTNGEYSWRVDGDKYAHIL